MEVTQNTGSKGLNTDIDEYLITADTLRYAMNIRLNNVSDNSFIITNVEGNEELFSLTRGFTPIGTVTDNSFTYIFSYNPLTKEGEIGTYPSLNYNELPPIPNSNIEPFYPFLLYPENHLRTISNNSEDVLQIVNKYSPLFNLEQTIAGNKIRKANRSIAWNFSLENPIVREVVAKLNFDYSYNLYWTDNFNAPKTMNGSISFYNGEYKLTEKIYEELDIEREINLLSTPAFLTNVSSVEIEEGGQLLTGNYTLYLVYNDNGLYTIPQANTNKISIYFTKANLNYGGTESISTTTGITPIDNLRTTKKIVVNFNIDVSYPSYRIWIEHNQGTDISQPLFYEIDKDFKTSEVEFTGFERLLPITSEQINSIYYGISRAKTITQHDSRLFLGNITTINYNIKNLKELALRFELGYKILDMNISQMPYAKMENAQLPLLPTTTGINPNGYADWYNIYNYLGYWGEEQYAFAIVFKLENGDETEAFPVKGYDYSTTIGLNPNEDGIIKMPKRNITGIIDTNNNLKIFGVTLSFNTVSADSTLFDGILGYKIVRADRNKNIITQGYSYSGYLTLNGTNDVGQDWENNQLNNVINPNDVRLKTIPAPSGLLQCESWRDTAIDVDVFTDPVDVYISPFKRDLTRLTFYSNDVELDRITWDTMDNYEAFVKPIGYVTNKENTFNAIYNFPTPVNYKNTMLLQHWYNETEIDDKISKYKSWKVDNGRDISNGKFSSNIERLSNISSYFLFGLPISISLFYQNMKHRFTKYTGLQWQSGNQIETPFNSNSPNLNMVLKSANNQDKSTLLNVYRLNPNTPYTSFYNSPTTLQYKPVTQWKAIDKNILTFDNLSNTTKVETDEIYNGDCYLGFGFKRLWYSELKGNTYTVAGNSNTDNELGRTGIILQLLSENNFNPHLRALEVVDINEQSNLEPNTNKRAYYPLSYVEQNDFRSFPDLPRYGYRTSIAGNISNQIFSIAKSNTIPDSNASNKGYSISLPNKRYTLNDKTLPFQSISFPTRIIYSEQQSALSFTDNYRNIKPANSQDYDLTRGEIVDIESIGGNIIASQEKSITLIPYKERVPLNQESQIFISGTGVLTPYSQSLATFGSQHTHSIIKTDRTLYGTDINRRKIWQLNGNDVKAISDFIVESYLCKDEQLGYLDRLSFYNNKTDIINNLCVRTGYDNFNQEVLFTFFLKDNAEVSFTIVYSEMMGIWTSFYSMQPSLYWNRGNNLLSFNNEDYSKDNEQKAFIHNRNNRNTFYNEFTNSEIEIIVNANTESSKVFDNHSVISNNIYPSNVKWSNENQIADRTREWLLRMRRLRQEENRVQIIIGSSEVDKREEYNHNRQNSRIRDKYMKVRFTYDTKKELRIQRILTKFRRSFN